MLLDVAKYDIVLRVLEREGEGGCDPGVGRGPLQQPHHQLHVGHLRTTTLLLEKTASPKVIVHSLWSGFTSSLEY